ncbi:hypothetical protein [Stutzerimonas nitrititolerans]|uniref:hypothetical protein n=1 Tax=Stutzerimonas nitrititolerans TaxID=2482751 RepID=UPI00289F1E29|nr:hypothetical protein [Stutzerimonas nitrititolerans]
MKIDIEITAGATGCKVRLDSHEIPFTSEAEARAFVQRLQARLQAPHPLPQQPCGETAQAH